MVTLAENIKHYRKLNKLTQKSLADKLGIVPTAISAWETGRNKPLMDNVEQMAQLFNIKKSKLLGDDLLEMETTHSSAKSDNLQSELLTTFNQLLDNRKKLVVDYSDELLKEQIALAAGEEIRGDQVSDSRFTGITGIYSQLTPQRQKEVLESLKRQLSDQNVIKLKDIQKVQDLYETLGTDTGEVKVYGEVSAGTGVWGEEIIETIRYPLPIPNHDIALRVNGNSMEPMFHDGEIVFIRKTQDVHHGQIVVMTVDGNAYIKKLYKQNGEIRLVSLNPNYNDIILTEDNDIRVEGVVVV